MVKVIRLQKPSPNARLTASGEAPLPNAASATTTTAIATKMKASGNQRSAHAVKPMAIRTSRPSCFVLSAGTVGSVVVMDNSPPEPKTFLIGKRSWPKPRSGRDSPMPPNWRKYWCFSGLPASQTRGADSYRHSSAANGLCAHLRLWSAGDVALAMSALGQQQNWLWRVVYFHRFRHPRGIRMASSFRDAELAGWSARSTSYDHYLSPITNQVIAPIISALGPVGGKRVLDVCCGPGHLAGAMAAAGADVEGIDFAATMVTNARDNYPNLGFREGDAEALPYPDGAFDHVVCAFGVMHIGHPDVAMAEASRVLQPGGRYVFTQWAMDDEVLRIVLIGHCRPWGAGLKFAGRSAAAEV